ncbi:unnamed protein product [Closterium sp. NIES-54]
MYAVTDSAEGDCYLSVPPDPGIEAAALGASASAAPGTGESAALGAGDRPVAVSLADPSGGPVLAHSSMVLPCPAAPSGWLSRLHLPSFSTNLVSGADLQDAWVDQFTPGGQRVTHCTCSRTGRHQAMFIRRLGLSLYTLTTASPPVTASGQVAASSQVFAGVSRSGPASAPCSCRPLSRETLLWHHRLGHPSLPRLRGMASRTLDFGLPWLLPPLPLGPAPTCVHCVEGRQRAAPHSSEFPLTEAPLQTLHMDVWGPARVRGQGHKCYFLLVVDDYSHYSIVFPLRSKGDVTQVLIDWIHGARRQLSESFGSDLPVLCLHSDRGGEFSSDILRAFCRAEGIRQRFTLPASSQKNGIAERHIGMVMDVARTSMIHPRVSLPETTPTLQWTGKVGDASVFRVWGSRAFVRDTSAHKVSSRAVPRVFLGFPHDAPGWQFYHPTLRRVLSSQVDHAEPVEVAVDSSAAMGAKPAGAGSGGAEPGGVEPGGAEPERVEPGGAEFWGAESGRAEPGGAEHDCGEPRGTASGGAEPARAKCGGATGVAGGAAGAAGGAAGAGPAGGASDAGAPGGAAGAGAAGGAAGAGAAGAARGSTGAAGGIAGAGAAGGAACAGAAGDAGGTGAVGGLGGACNGGSGAAGTGGAARVVVEDTGAEAAGAVSAVSGGATWLRPYYVPLLQQSRSASPVRTVRAGRRVLHPESPPVPGTHSMTLRPSTAPQHVPLPSTPASSLPDGPDPESDSLRAASPVVMRFLATAVTDPLFKSTATSALVAELVEFATACCLDYTTSLVAESVSASVCPPSVGGECALGMDVLEDTQEEFECFTAAVPHLVSMLLASEGDPDAPDIPTSRSYADEIEGTYVDEVPPPRANIISGMWIFRVKQPPGSPPVFKARYIARGFNQRQGVEFFQTFSPTPKMTTLWVLLHVTAQHDYELHLLDFSTAFLRGSLHEEIWLRCPAGFTGSFPAGTKWSLWRLVYGLRQAPREWHDTLRMSLAALGFAPSTADPSLFLRTDTTLPPFYVLVYVESLVFATADSEALAHVKSELHKRHTCTYLGELTSYLGLRITRDRAQCTITLTQLHMVQQVLQRFGFTYSSPESTPLPSGHSLPAPPSDESVEPSGSYPELVGCLMHRKLHWDAAKRVLRYLCSTSGMGLVLGGRARVVLTGHTDASWVDDLAMQQSSQGYTFSLGSGSLSWRSTHSSSVLSSSCEAEIYAGAMAAQELRWLNYLLIDLGEAPRSPPVLYVENKAMLALCQEHRLEHRLKHIYLRYFLARELQQRGQLRLAYVSSQANTADVFTKALQPCDHQRFCSVLGLVPSVPHLLTS